MLKGVNMCEYCDDEFVVYGEIEKHVRNTHTFECQICKFRNENKKKLDMHLFTCEIYKCYTCDYRHKRLIEMKGHCKIKHNKNTMIQLFKLDGDIFWRLLVKNILVMTFLCFLFVLWYLGLTSAELYVSFNTRIPVSGV